MNRYLRSLFPSMLWLCYVGLYALGYVSAPIFLAFRPPLPFFDGSLSGFVFCLSSSEFSGNFILF